MKHSYPTWAARDLSPEAQQPTGADDHIVGSPGDDHLRGRGGDDTLDGAAGNDVLSGGRGSDQLNGGDGYDIAYFSAERDGFVADLRDGRTVATSSGIDTLNGIEGLIAGHGDDRVTGTRDSNLLAGRNGDDTLLGGGGLDTLLGGSGEDRIDEAQGSAYIDGGDGDDILRAASASDGAQSNTLRGGAGRDILETYASDLADVALLVGGTGDDQIFAHGAATIKGGAGTDRLFELGEGGTSGFLSGGSGDDQLHGPGVLRGQGGADTLFASGATSTLDGGAGHDTVVFSKPATVDLRITGPQETGQGLLVLRKIEALTGDEATNTDNAGDHFIGNGSRNRLDGKTGPDTLSGRGGDDILVGDPQKHGSVGPTMHGGAGDDKLYTGHIGGTLHGGAGADNFIFKGDALHRDADFGTATMILDLSNADTLDLSHFDKKLGIQFHLVDHFDGRPDEITLVYDKASRTTWLEGTTDEDSAPELIIGLSGNHLDFGNLVL